MESMASMHPDCPYCNPNGKTKTQQAQNTAETYKPEREEKQAQDTKLNVTPKLRTTPRIIRGNNTKNAVTGLSSVPKPKSIF